MSDIQRALADGVATIPQLTQYVRSVAERLRGDKQVCGTIDFDERAIGDLLKAAKDLWEAVDPTFRTSGRGFL